MIYSFSKSNLHTISFLLLLKCHKWLENRLFMILEHLQNIAFSIKSAICDTNYRLCITNQQNYLFL